MYGPLSQYLLVLHDNRARISYIKTEKSVTRFPIIFISVKTEFTIQFLFMKKW